ncbi:SDR family oxidoreductase [Streptomyces sp. NPDC055239]
MTPRLAHLMTGATGFLGSAILLELLTRTDDDIWCLVRGPDIVRARSRLNSALTRTADTFRRSAALAESRATQRCHVVLGDVERSTCGISADDLPRIGRVWHCAATLRYEDAFSKEIHQANVMGAQNALALAQRLNAELNYVSTAYVAGQHRGVQGEALPECDRPTGNLYERSKINAELLIAASSLPSRILRPSAVVGHSSTLRTPGHSGLYDVAAKVLRFRRQYAPRFPELLSRSATLPSDPLVDSNLVPVDHVAAFGVQAGLAGPTGTVFHLTNATSPTVGEAYACIFEWAGLPRPRFAPDAVLEHHLDRRLAQILDFHLPYTRGQLTFDRTNTAALVGEEAMAFHAPSPVIRELLDHYAHAFLPHPPSASRRSP